MNCIAIHIKNEEKLCKIQILPYTVMTMQPLDQILQKQPLFYVARDIERALAGANLPGVFIISNLTEYSKKIAVGQEQILLIQEEKLLDTWELMRHSKTQEFIRTHALGAPPSLLVFKNTTEIERICAEQNWQIMNPSARMSQKIEEKITQVEWLGELASMLPPHKIQIASEVLFEGTPFILQFNRAHTGQGTMMIESAEQLAEIQTKFPNRPVRVTQFIEGAMLTSNNAVAPDTTLVGNISYQITGIAPFTNNPFTTIGNDWELPHRLLSAELKKQYVAMVEKIGDKLRTDGWKGLFGVDIILDVAAQKLYLIEINARQPASTTFESELQKLAQKNEHEITTFEAHLLGLFGIPFGETKLIALTTGAQIIQRVSETTQNKNQSVLIEQLQSLSLLNIIPYASTDLGSDWIRIQSKDALMQAPGELNILGLSFQNILLA